MITQLTTGNELYLLVSEWATIQLLSVGVYPDDEPMDNRAAAVLTVDGEVVAYTVLRDSSVLAIETHPGHYRKGYAAQLVRGVGATDGAFVLSKESAAFFESLSLPYFWQA